MTSLAEQLRRLALPGSGVSEELVKRSSLLFDPKKAATLDRDTFYALGVNGFEELCSIDSTLHDEFYGALFSETAKNTERSVLSQEDNSKLNNNIQSFLLRISPYFLMRPTQKCLEWLIFRYRIHCFNVDDIMRSFLPFHDTKIFVKLIQLLEIAHPTNKWCWIAPIQKPGVALAKATISMHCVKDSSFFYFICDAVVKMIKAHSVLSDASGCLRSMINFYASVTLGTIHNMDKISDQFLTQIVPFLVKGLKSREADYQAATYIIISQISIKATLTEQVVTSLLKSLCKCNVGRLYRELLTTVIIVCQTQENLKSLPSLCLQKLCSSPYFLEYLDGYNKSNDIERFLKLFLSRIIPAIFSQSISGFESSVDNGNDLDETCGNFKKIFLAVVQTFHTTPKLQEFIIRILLEEFVKHDAASTTHFNQLIQQVQRKFPETFDKVVANLSQKAGSSFGKCLNKFINVSMDMVKHQATADGNVSLVLSFCHPEPAVRLSAVGTLREMLLTNSEMVNSEFVKDSIKQRLLFDDAPNVVSDVLKLVQSHPTILTSEIKLFCEILIKLVFRSRNADWDDVYLASLSLLTSDCFASCFDDVKNIIAIVVYDAMLQEISVEKEYSAYNCCVRNSFFELSSRMLVPLKSSTDMKPFLADMAMLFEKDTKLVCDLWKALLDIASFLETDEMKTIKLRPPSYYMISHVVFCVIRQADTSSIPTELVEICKNFLFDVLDDFEQIICFYQHVTLSEEPHSKKAKTYFTQFDSMDDSLTKMVISFTNTEKEYQLALIKINVLCSLLIDCFSILRKTETGQLSKIYENYSIICQDCDGNNIWDSSNIHPNMKNAIFSHLLRFLTLGSFDSDLIKILRSLVQNFFVTFSSFEMLISFLGSYWNPQLGNREAEILSVQSLYLGQAVLLGNTDHSLALDCVIPSLLAALAHSSSAVRKAALTNLDACTKFNVENFRVLICYLAKHRDELESDPLSIVELLGIFFSSSSKKKSTKKFEHEHQNVLDVLLKQHICTEDVPTTLRVVWLKMLRKVNSVYLCSLLLPTVEQLMDLCEKVSSPESVDDTTMDKGSQKEIIVSEASLLCESILKFDAAFLVNDKIKSLFKKAISCNLKLPSDTSVHRSPQSVALGMVNKSYFSTLTLELKQELLSLILNAGTNSQDPSTAISVAKFFKAVSLDASLVAGELVKVLQLKKIMPVPSPVKARKTRRLEREQKFIVNINEISPSSQTWKRTTLLLELIQHKKKIFNFQLLFPALFEVLEFILDISNDQSEDSEFDAFEYIKQLLLTTMLNHFQKLKTNLVAGDQSKSLNSSHCKIELLVHCVRTSENAQTQQHALLLLSEVATIFPDEVLHNVMSIFTFMGSHMLRQDDAYTFQVISTTIRSILPALMKSNKEKNNNNQSIEETVLTVLRVFVDSLPHIPSHRRVTVFQEVLNTVGDEKHLWMILVLLVDQYACKPAVEEPTDHSLDITASDFELSDAVSPLMAAMEIWMSIFQLSSTETQVKSLISCLEYIITIPNQSSAVKLSQSVKMQPPVLNVRMHSTNQLRRIKLALLTFFSHLLQQNHSHFDSCLRENEQDSDESNEQSEEASGIRLLFQSLFEKLLDVIHQAELSNKEQSDSKTVKYYKVLIHKAYNVMHQINFLLPLNTFLLIIDGLLKNKLMSTQRKALELLAERISSTSGNLDFNEAATILNITKELMQLATNSVENTSEKHAHGLLRYSSLITLKLIIRSYARANPHHFVNSIPLLANIITNNKNEDNQILSASLLCLAELCSTLKAYCISHLNSFVPAILQLMCTSRSLQNEMILFSCVTALHRLLEHLPNFISPFLDGILTKVTSLLLLKKYVPNDESPADSNTNMTTQISTRLKVVTNILATKVPSRVLIPAFNKCREKVEMKRPLCLKSLCDIVHKHVASLDKNAVGRGNQSLVSLFMEILDIRTKNFEGVSDNEVGEIEDNACEALTTVMLKLSENSFRPLFFKLYDWACLSEDSPERLLTYYKLMYKLSSRMKGLFSMFAGHLITHIANLLKEARKSDKTENFPQDGAKKTSLLKFVCDTLNNTFLYDTSGFLSRDRFEILMHPMVDQLEQLTEEADELDVLVNEHVIPCLGQMAASVSDDVCWKPFNYQILIKSRHASWKVRFASLHAIQSVAEKLGEDYTILLPESVPFFAELMEDEEENVEKKCHEVIRKLEKILGEPLQKYF